MMTRDLSWAPKADFVKILLPLVAAAGFSRLRGGPKRLKTDPFEVKNAQSTSNGAFLRVLGQFFGLLKKHKILHRFFKRFQAQDGVSDLPSGAPPPCTPLNIQRFLDFTRVLILRTRFPLPGLARRRKARPGRPRRCKRHRLTMRRKVAAQAVESVRPLFAVAVFVRTGALEDVRASRLA